MKAFRAISDRRYEHIDGRKGSCCGDGGVRYRLQLVGQVGADIGIVSTGIGCPCVVVNDRLPLLIFTSIISPEHRLLKVVIVGITWDVNTRHCGPEVTFEVFPRDSFLSHEWSALGIFSCVPLSKALFTSDHKNTVGVIKEAGACGEDVIRDSLGDLNKVRDRWKQVHQCKRRDKRSRCLALLQILRV